MKKTLIILLDFMLNRFDDYNQTFKKGFNY